MNKKIEVYIKGQINSRELYNRLINWEPCVTDVIVETYVCVATGINEVDCEQIEKICREYGECEVEITTILPA